MLFVPDKSREDFHILKSTAKEPRGSLKYGMVRGPGSNWNYEPLNKTFQYAAQ